MVAPHWQVDWLLASRALDAFSACLADSGGAGGDASEGVARALRRTNVFPLLGQLWGQADALLRRSVATTVAAMSVPGVSVFSGCAKVHRDPSD